MSLAPEFVLWALVLCNILLVGGFTAWMISHRVVVRLVRRLWLSDGVALWLAFAAGYHLARLPRWRLEPDGPAALWLLCGFLGVYYLLRRLPSPARRPELLLAAAVLAWSLVIVAGFRHVDTVQADADALAAAAKPASAKSNSSPLETRNPSARPLRRALTLPRLDEPLRRETGRALAMAEGREPPDPAFLASFRLQALPRLNEVFRRELARLRTLQWVQAGLLVTVLVVWGYGHPPDWERLAG